MKLLAAILSIWAVVVFCYLLDNQTTPDEDRKSCTNVCIPHTVKRVERHLLPIGKITCECDPTSLSTSKDEHKYEGACVRQCPHGVLMISSTAFSNDCECVP
jgi:hypothetical protein